MKPILLVCLILLNINTYGQTDIRSSNSMANNYNQLNDSLPQIIYNNKPSPHKNPAWFVNNQFVGESVAKILNPDQIASINVEKKIFKIGNFSYDGRVAITMKEGYRPKFISLNDLKTKYTNLKDLPVLFMVENDIIQEDYGKCMVDENYLLQIVVDKVDLTDEKLNFFLIKLLTRTPENIRKSKEIRIRGTHEPGKN